MVPKTVSPVVLFLFSIVALITVFFINETDTNKWIVRVIVSLAASAISISIPGMLKVDTDNTSTTMAEKAPRIVASGAIAVFVLVYLFNTIN